MFIYLWLCSVVMVLVVITSDIDAGFLIVCLSCFFVPLKDFITQVIVILTLRIIESLQIIVILYFKI